MFGDPEPVVQHAVQEDVFRTDVPTFRVPATEATKDVVQDGINHPAGLRKSILERAENVATEGSYEHAEP